MLFQPGKLCWRGWETGEFVCEMRQLGCSAGGLWMLKPPFLGSARPLPRREKWLWEPAG